MGQDAEFQDENTIRRLADYERFSGIAWIILGILQCLSIILIIAGVWNIFAGRSHLKMSPRIRSRDADVPAAYQGMGGLIAVLVINLIFGGIIGIAFVVVDFIIRDQILSHAYLFSNGPAPSSAAPPPLEPTS